MKLRLPAFCDMHVHARQGDALSVINYSAEYAQHIMLMPNTNPPLLTVSDVREYDQQVQEVLRKDVYVHVHYTLYVNEETTTGDIHTAADSGMVRACKIYPKAATTHSDLGVRDYTKLKDVLKVMEERDLVCCLHGEAPWVEPPFDVFNWEEAFVGYQFAWIIKTFPKLRVVLEHITTEKAVEAVLKARPGVAATITAHHLHLTRDDILAYGIRPLNYCKPVAKRYPDRDALVRAATSGHNRFMLGSDSAPHDAGGKFSECGCAGCFTAPLVPQAVLTAFDSVYQAWGDTSCEDTWEDAGLGALEAFLGGNAMRFYRLTSYPCDRNITLERTLKRVPKSISLGGQEYPVWEGGKEWLWNVVENQ